MTDAAVYVLTGNGVEFFGGGLSLGRLHFIAKRLRDVYGARAFIGPYDRAPVDDARVQDVVDGWRARGAAR